MERFTMENTSETNGLLVDSLLSTSELIQVPSTPPRLPRISNSCEPLIFHSTPTPSPFSTSTHTSMRQSHSQSQSQRSSQTFTFGHVEESFNMSMSGAGEGDQHQLHSPRLNYSAPLTCGGGGSSVADLSLMELQSMDASQLRSALEESILENSSLRCELVDKNRQLRTTKMKVKVLLDLDNELRKSPDADPDATLELDTSLIQEREFLHETRSITVKNAAVNVNTLPTTEVTILPTAVATTSPGINILPENTFVMIRQITSRIEVHQVRERMVEGIHMSNQLALGGLTGWSAAYLLRNFGKTAIIALSGGIGLLALANHKGFVEINWNGLFEEIQRRRFPNEVPSGSGSSSGVNSSTSSDDSGNTVESNENDWTAERVDNLKKWVREHSITAAGFAGAFLYSVL